ncbi:MAG: hypothetical protein V8S58_06135 [Lachnospiraceae bacterium]
MKMKDILYDKSGKVAGGYPAGTALLYRKNPAEIRAYFIFPWICESVSLERTDEIADCDRG